MKKKKITPQDLELNIEVIGGKKFSSRLIETKTCTPTHGTCEGEHGCDTTTPNPTVPECKTIEEAGCLPSQTCRTVEATCETKVGCYDSHSHAQLCCPVTEQTGCRKTVDNCLTVDICGPNTLNICLETSNLCAATKVNCFVTDAYNTCACINTLKE